MSIGARRGTWTRGTNPGPANRTDGHRGAVVAAVALAWRSTFPTEGTRCSRACTAGGLRCGSATSSSPARRATPRRGLVTSRRRCTSGSPASQTARDGGSFAAPADGSSRLWADVTTGRHSRAAAAPTHRCGASARSFTPSRRLAGAWPNIGCRHRYRAGGATRARSRSTSTRRSSLPDGDLGISSMSSQRAHPLVRGDAPGDERHQLVAADRPARATTNAFGISPASSSATGTTQASATAGWVSRSASSIAGGTW